MKVTDWTSGEPVEKEWEEAPDLAGAVTVEAPSRSCDWCGSPLAPTDPAICEPCIVAFRVETMYGFLADADPDFDELAAVAVR